MSENMVKAFENLFSKLTTESTLSPEAAKQYHQAMEKVQGMSEELETLYNRHDKSQLLLKQKQEIIEDLEKKVDDFTETIRVGRDRERRIDRRELRLDLREQEVNFHKMRVDDHKEMMRTIFKNNHVSKTVHTVSNEHVPVQGNDQCMGFTEQVSNDKTVTETTSD